MGAWGGSFALDWVAGLPWTEWQLSRGLGGRLQWNTHLDALLAANTHLHAVYSLKEQLRQLWESPANAGEMARRLDDWCALAEATGLSPVKRFVAMLRSHRQGICHYADHPIATARIEAGNVAISMIRKRARGLIDTAYFKLKIRQSALLEPTFGLYALTG